jgi:hypothetical protein
MNGTLFALLMGCVGEALAHSGHEAPLVHLHSWDWLYLALGMGAVAALAIWRAK